MTKTMEMEAQASSNEESRGGNKRSRKAISKKSKKMEEMR
jgi:hypothetical protein